MPLKKTTDKLEVSTIHSSRTRIIYYSYSFSISR